MAAFLNKPSDFVGKSSCNQEPLKLMAPSEFEKPKSSQSQSAWLGGRAEGDEILALKLENERFRGKLQAQGSSMSESRSDQPTVSQRSLPAEERRYADELISRQAEELSKLRLQVQHLEQQEKIVRSDYEHRLAECEQDWSQTEAALSEDLRRSHQDHEQEIGRLVSEHDGVVADLQARLQHATADLERSKGQLTAQLTDVTEELRAARREAGEREEALQREIRETAAALESQGAQVQSLRTYITESEQQHQPHQVWVQQCQTLDNKLKVAEAEKENLQSSAQLMDVRLSSMKEILNTQETELSKGKEDTTDKKKLQELLLTRWRQKVYALLVQQKSSQMVSRKDLQNWKEKTEVLEDKLVTAGNTINILQHTVAQREAELQLAVNTAKRLQGEVDQAEQVALCLDAQMGLDGAALQQLSGAAHTCQAQLSQQTSVLQQALGQLKALGQRVSFASSRMDVLKSQMVRKEALKAMDNTDSQAAPPDSESEETWRTEKEHVGEELRRVSRERDTLAAQLQHDSGAWADKLSSLRSQLNSEVGSLKRTVEDLELVNQEKSRMLERLRAELEGTQSELLETKERVELLSTELARHQFTAQQVLEDQRRTVEGEFTDQLADMERRLNEARREHTKAVVTLRQHERQWGRERERGEEVAATTAAHYTAQLDTLQREMQGVERERNIFMATLRQEGLLGKLRSERGAPMRLELTEDEAGVEPQDSQDSRSAAEDTATDVTRTDSMQSHTQESSEPVSAVLEDLRSLVPAVLDDSLDSSDENQE